MWLLAFHRNGTFRCRRKGRPLHRLRELEQAPPATAMGHGFRTLVLNRTRRGGILARGAAFSRSGENGKGLLSRRYPKHWPPGSTRFRRMRTRSPYAEGDGMKLLPIPLRCRGQHAAAFLGPPHTASDGKRAGSRLCKRSNLDHASLFAMTAEQGPISS